MTSIKIRICYKCKTALPINNFYKNRSRYDGYQTWCKDCLKKYVSFKYKNDLEYHSKINYSSSHHPKAKEYRNTAARNYRKKNKEKINDSRRIGRLLTKNGMRNILIKRSNGYCELCKTPIKIKPSGYAVHHLDKNKENNVLPNLTIVCTKCHLHVLHKDVYIRKS